MRGNTKLKKKLTWNLQICEIAFLLNREFGIFLGYLTTVFGYVPKPVCEKLFFCSLCLSVSAWNFSGLCTRVLFLALLPWLPKSAVVTVVWSH